MGRTHGFPKPNCHNGHTRSYSHEEIIHLHEIKKRIDQGERLSKLLGKNAAAPLTQLRASLPSDVALWVGGSGAKRLVTVPSGIDVQDGSATEVVAAFSATKTKFTIHSQSEEFP